MTYFNFIFCLPLLGTLLQANLVWSDSSIFVQNNSDEQFTFSCESGLSKDYWDCDSGTILPGRRKRVSRLNRDQGITWGSTFNIRQYLKLNGENVVFLAQRLNGNFIGSDILQSIQGDGFHEDSGVLRNGGPYGDFHVRYQAYFTGGDDDIEYIITKKKEKQIDLPSTKNDPDSINIVTYNTWFPLDRYACDFRARIIPSHLEQYDVIIFNEVNAKSCRDVLLSTLTSFGFIYTTEILDGTIGQGLTNGGVMIVSKFKITKEDQHVYGDACGGDDCLAAKGVNYARINKNGKNYHIFGTHAQADSPLGSGLIVDKDQSGNRAKQFQQMEDFITRTDIPKNEPVILGGDFNVESITGEYLTMLSILQASEPRHVKKNGIVSHYPEGNDFLSGGISDDLDYILVSANHQPSSGGFTQVHFVKSWDAFKPISTDIDTWDLSDHFPVAAHLKFTPLPTPPPTPLLCGGHDAPNCEACPYDKNGNFVGSVYCNGQCHWCDGECQSDVCLSSTLIKCSSIEVFSSIEGFSSIEEKKEEKKKCNKTGDGACKFKKSKKKCQTKCEKITGNDSTKCDNVEGCKLKGNGKCKKGKKPKECGDLNKNKCLKRDDCRFLLDGDGDGDDGKCTDPSNLFSFKGPLQIEECSVDGEPAAVLAAPPTDYSLQFTAELKSIPGCLPDLFEEEGIEGGYASIITLTNNGREVVSAYGQLVPGVYLLCDTTEIWVGVDHDGPMVLEKRSPMILKTPPLQLNKKYTVLIKVFGTTGTITVNGNTVDTQPVGQRSQLYDVELYLGDPYHIPSDVILSDITFNSL